MTHADLLIHSASQLLTLAGGPQRGSRLGELGLLENGALAARAGRILEVGPTAALLARYQADEQIDARQRVVMPAFVDPHTHAVWAGDRADEFALRVAGASYMEIMESGGGIASTVRRSRDASLAELLEETRPRLRRMLAHGTTLAEVKTGYGLETGSELKLLEAILRLDQEGLLELVPTFMGAHAVPGGHPGGAGSYADLVRSEMLPALRTWWRRHAKDRPLPFVDVFCEPGAFDLEQSRLILEHARTMGFPLKIHVDEFESLGGARLAVELGAVSADHLVATPEEEIALLGGSETVAVALPCTPFGLAEKAYTPAQALLRAGALLAIATDLNPGTAWCESMQFAIALACRYMGLTQAQAIAAATINAAAAIQRQGTHGSLQAGKQADVLILEADDYRQLGYRFGTNLVDTVIKGGRILIRGGTEAWSS